MTNQNPEQIARDHIDKLLISYDKLNTNGGIEEPISQNLLQSESLKQSILKKAFEGRLLTTIVEH